MDACQMQTLPRVSLGLAKDYRPSLRKRLRSFIATRMSPHSKRQIKAMLADPQGWIRRKMHKRATSRGAQTGVAIEKAGLKGGDLVRVRSKEEIQASLDRWGQFRGCSFLDEMYQYCGSTQHVFKPVARFVDERDRKVRHSKGIVLLKDVYCEGTEEYGPCDRSCLYFWREEWLETVEGSAEAHK